jgi:hypothetical protein
VLLWLPFNEGIAASTDAQQIGQLFGVATVADRSVAPLIEPSACVTQGRDPLILKVAMVGRYLLLTDFMQDGPWTFHHP